MRLLSGFSVRLERKAYRCVYLYHSDGWRRVVWYLKAVQLENGIKIQLGMIKKLIDLGEENQAEETKERIIQKMKDKTDTIIDEALEPTEIQNF